MFKYLVNRNDGREARVLQYVKDHAHQGNPVEVMKAIDTFGWNEEWLMNVGDDKGEILTEAVKSKQPKNALELGAYCGYSAVRIGSMLPNTSHLTSIEINPNNAAVAKAMVEYAGLGEKVDIVVGTVTTTLKDHMAKHQIPPFDFVFIDHAKDYYLSDFRYLLQEGMIEKNAMIVADNIFFPGAPDYRHFVNTHPKMKTIEHHRKVEYSNMYDIVTVTELLDDFSL
jgi:catechol O-methyltransferase